MNYTALVACTATNAAHATADHLLTHSKTVEARL